VITFFSILKNYGIDPNSIRLVRHGNKEISVLNEFRTNIERLTQYSSWMREDKYGDADYLAIFSSDRGTTSLFLGIWRIEDCTLNNELRMKHRQVLKRFCFPDRWFETSVYYQLTFTDLMFDLSQRLVIDWGGSTRSWVQKRDKAVVAIKYKNAIQDFVSYNAVQLPFQELKRLFSNPDANFTWMSALSSVNGIYLIRHIPDGLLYVGSAYGDGGIWSRWEWYSRTGHCGNKKLKLLNPDNFEFSIIEILPGSFSANEVIERENRWKRKLGTRAIGLNDN
jgi:hypothetical protein